MSPMTDDSAEELKRLVVGLEQQVAELRRTCASLLDRQRATDYRMDVLVDLVAMTRAESATGEASVSPKLDATPRTLRSIDGGKANDPGGNLPGT